MNHSEGVELLSQFLGFLRTYFSGFIRMSISAHAVPMHRGISFALRYPVPEVSSSMSELKKFSDTRLDTALVL